MNNDVSIIGGGPAGLFAADLLLEAGLKVTLYDRMSSVGKKFLVAGHGGLNLTHSEELESFSKRYDQHHELFESLLTDFSPDDLRKWCSNIGVDTFIGSTGRVFPKVMNAAQILINWVNKLKSNENFTLITHCEFQEIDDEQNVIFNKNGQIIYAESAYTIFALGGGSWSKTGSNGHWAIPFLERGIEVIPFQSMNCGFEVQWSEVAKELFSHIPLKNIKVIHSKKTVRGEVMLTPYGIEGGAIYALSKKIRDNINETLYIDLLPDLKNAQILKRLKKPQGKNSLSNHLRKVLNLDQSKYKLLKELTSKDEFCNIDLIAKKIKKLPIKISKERPIDEAISTSGGVSFNEIDSSFMLKQLPSMYVSGEMIDWDAPTGGYLLQGCFSISYRVAQDIIVNYLGSSI